VLISDKMKWCCLTSLFRKPKNARSKRALEAREPKEVEDERTIVFVQGTKTGEIVDKTTKELVCVSFIFQAHDQTYFADGTQKTARDLFFKKEHYPPV